MNVMDVFVITWGWLAGFIEVIYSQNLEFSLTLMYGDTYSRRASKLKEDVRMMLHEVVEPLDQLELVDVLQRLGLSYHFEEEIRRILNSIYGNDSDEWKNENLYAVALEFRLLRQHGYNVPQDVFNSFKDDMGNFKASLCEDTKGMLCFYEASYLSKEGESILEEARNYTAKHLEEYLKMQNRRDEDVAAATLVSHALELPLHWRMLRLEVRWFIDVYERQPYMNPMLLELAKLDFNMVQATHQEDPTHMSRWWRSTGLGERLNFARDRLMENFLWTVGVIFEPQFGYCRRMSTKVNALITIIDDIYDVYGTLDELETFADVIERLVRLTILINFFFFSFFIFFSLTFRDPNSAYIYIYYINIYIYMKLIKCRTSFPHLIIIIYIYRCCRKLSLNILFLLSDGISMQWTNQLSDYMKICFFALYNSVNEMAYDILKEQGFHIIPYLRKADELKRGDVPKSIQCFMYEIGASEDDARDHIKCLISEMWKKMNGD
ncbi:hypothetical protein L1049_020915 [Liquidambar formosana]|uniref:Uncharacterized protein n=1 Tax=Liquidambar formosana TaxID=63359 RepID=A0AAP0SAN7_LIQFO